MRCLMLELLFESLTLRDVMDRADDANRPPILPDVHLGPGMDEALFLIVRANDAVIRGIWRAGGGRGAAGGGGGGAGGGGGPPQVVLRVGGRRAQRGPANF